MAETNIHVEKNPAVDGDFITGADISSYIAQINSGVTYYDFDGKALDEQGFFGLLVDSGMNYVRVRVWNDPYESKVNGYGGGNNDLDTAVKIGKYATKAGMQVLINFHLSDFWADPGKQRVPKAWSNMTITEKEEAVYTYIYNSIETLLNENVDVGMVQVGNETNTSISGETSPENMCALYKAGSKAVRDISSEFSKDILVALHFANPEIVGRYEVIAKMLDDYDVDYDVFASSYYPFWHGTLDNLTSLLKDIVERYDKKVMVVETSWAYTLEDGDSSGNTVSEGSYDTGSKYEFSVQGQVDLVSSVVKAVTDVGDAGIGVFYWEPAWIPVEYAYDENGNLDEAIVKSNRTSWEKHGSGWTTSYAKSYSKDNATNNANIQYGGGSSVDNQALFDFWGHPLESLRVFDYIRTGTT